MKQNYLYLIIGAVCVVAAILGYQLYQSQHESNGVQIKIDDNGISIKKN